MRLFLKVLVSLVLLGVIFWQLEDLGKVGELIGRIAPAYVLLILAVNTCDRGLMTFKWALLLRSRGLHLPFLRGMVIYCASMVWGMFLPTFGADVIRGFSTSRSGLDTHKVFASILIERMIGLISALVLGLFSLLMLSTLIPLNPGFDLVWWIGLGSLVVASAILIASLSQITFRLLYDSLLLRFQDISVIRRLKHFHSTFIEYQNDKTTLALFSAMTFGEQLIPILHCWLIAKALGIEVGLLFIAGVLPLALLISRIPVSINGLGVFDGVFVLLMSFLGVPAVEAITMVLFGRVIQVVSWLPWWLVHIVGTRSLEVPRPVLKQG